MYSSNKRYIVDWISPNAPLHLEIGAELIPNTIENITGMYKLYPGICSELKRIFLFDSTAKHLITIQWEDIQNF